jgi:hypothetical protein
MKKLIIAIGLIATVNSFAQTKSKSVLKDLNYGVSTMIGQGLIEPSLDVKKYFSLSAKKQTKFQLGFGVRLSKISGGYCLPYTTAPAKITKGSLTAAPNLANVDTVGLDNTNITALNVLLALNYHINSKFNIEFNIDLAGFSFGGKQNVYLRDKAGVDNIVATATATPTSKNLLLVSDNDWGTLHSELVGSYKLSNHLKLKSGFGFLFSEYTLGSSTYSNTSGIVVNNDRFRNKSLGFIAGVIYNF